MKNVFIDTCLTTAC